MARDSVNTKEYEANVSHTLLEIKENISAQPPPTYGTVVSQTPLAVAHKSSSDTLVVSVPQMFDHEPTECECWNCHERVLTRIGKRVGFLPWIVSLCLVTLCCWLGCCLIPFCINDLKDTEHYCPRCGTQLAYKRRL